MGLQPWGMSLGKSAMRAEELAKYFRAMLSSEDERHLAEELQGCNDTDWAAWGHKNRKAALQFLSATPAQRAKMLAKLEPNPRRHLLLSACLEADLADRLLCAAIELERGSDGSGDHGVECAARAAHELVAGYSIRPDWWLPEEEDLEDDRS
jgi:hypothetical protein